MASLLRAVPAFDLHLAVVSGKATPQNTLAATKPVIYGTAFHIGNGLFITAGHVYENASSDGPIVAICRLAEDGTRPFPVVAAEIHRGIDLAILSCPTLAKLPASIAGEL